MIGLIDHGCIADGFSWPKTIAKDDHQSVCITKGTVLCSGCMFVTYTIWVEQRLPLLFPTTDINKLSWCWY